MSSEFLSTFLYHFRESIPRTEFFRFHQPVHRFRLRFALRARAFESQTQISRPTDAELSRRISMAARGRAPSLLGKSAQAPGMMRHGPFPGHMPSGIRPLDHPIISPAEVLETKVGAQEAEMDRLAVENRRLAATHVALRQELAASQHELQRLHAHVESIHNDSDIQIRSFLDKIVKAEADIFASEEVGKELKKAHLEAQSLLTERQELASEIQHLTENLQKAKADIKHLPRLHADLEGLRHEHQKLRSAFELEKNMNKEQVEQMCGMEKNLIAMAKEVEKLRADLLNIEKAAQVSHQYGGTYGAAAPAPHPSNDQSLAYSHSGVAGYVQGYYGSAQMAQGGNAYSVVAGAVYPNGMQTEVGTNSSSGIIGGTYVGDPPLPAGPPPPSVGWR